MVGIAPNHHLSRLFSRRAAEAGQDRSTIAVVIGAHPAIQARPPASYLGRGATTSSNAPAACWGRPVDVVPAQEPWR